MTTGRVILDKHKCDSCFKCVEACHHNALGIYGREMTLPQVMKRILRDEIFYYHSGGGVTLSGGDVLCQPAFAQNILMACREAGLHTMAELNMFGGSQNIARLLPHLDEVYIDIKLMDSGRHKQWTGVENTSILQNIQKAASVSKPGALRIRPPLIWNVNDDAENIEATANYCKSLAACSEFEFLPYHRLGQAAHEWP